MVHFSYNHASPLKPYTDLKRNSRLRVNESFETSGRYVLPTLGCSWSQCLNMRIVLRRSPRQVSVTELAPDDTFVCVLFVCIFVGYKLIRMTGLQSGERLTKAITFRKKYKSLQTLVQQY